MRPAPVADANRSAKLVSDLGFEHSDPPPLAPELNISEDILDCVEGWVASDTSLQTELGGRV